MLRLAAILLIALYQASVYAGEIGMIVNGKAIHTSDKENYNEQNWGSGIQYKFDSLPSGWSPFITASGFVDSYNNSSYYAGGGYLHRLNGLSRGDNFTTSIGAVGFLMSREFKDGTRLLPGVLPVLSIGTDLLSINMTYVPKNSATGVPIYFFQAVVPIDNY